MLTTNGSKQFPDQWFLPPIFRSTKLFIFFCFFLSFAKFILIAKNEILAMGDDSVVYVRQSVGRWALDLPPGYSIWLRLTQPFGVPQRICIEVLYLLSIIFIAFAIRKCFGVLAGYAVCSLLVFAPLTFFLFDRTLCDGFFTCLNVLALGASLRMLAAETRLDANRWAIGLGGVLGWMAITRNEDPLILVWVLSLVCAAAFLWSQKRFSFLGWNFWRAPFTAGLLSGGIAFSVVLGICTSFYFANGVFAPSVSRIPGHMRFLSNLAQIDTGQPQTRYVPISRQSLRLAYTVSPFFAKLQHGMEDSHGSFQTASRESGLPDGEVGGGWIWMVINQQMFGAALGSAKNVSRRYEEMSNDVERAFKDGRLKRRFIIDPLLGGDPVGLLRRMPQSISDVLIATFSAYPWSNEDQWYDAALFDRVCFRRSELKGRPSSLRIQGWAAVDSPQRQIANVLVTSGGSDEPQVKAVPRPDVIAALSKQTNWKLTVSGFEVDIQNAMPESVNVTYLLDDGSRVQASRLKSTGTSVIEDKPGLKILQAVDLVDWHDHKREGARHRLQLKLVQLSQSSDIRWFVLGLFLLTLGVASNLALWKKQAQWRLFFVFFCFTLTLCCARVLFYAVIDAAAWPGNQHRYLAPSGALGWILVSVSGTVLLVAAGEHLFRQRGRSHNEDGEVADSVVYR